MSKCKFNKAWIGQCKNEKPCADHADKVCCSCGQPATHECAETGQFICGYLLCDDCEHAIAPNGSNGGVGFYTTVPPEMRENWKTHILKSAQKYTSWWDREDPFTSSRDN